MRSAALLRWGNGFDLMRRYTHSHSGHDILSRLLAEATAPRVVFDSIPYLILFGLILLIVWLWRRFRHR